MLRGIELFAGAGGLGMGLSLAGIQSLGVIEWNKDACDTIRGNQRRGFPLVREWPLFEGDARKFKYSTLPSGIDLVSGGPPCQPFSICGKHRAYRDERDMFPVAVEAVRTLQPRAFIMENVRGLTRAAFANYFDYILRQFEFPEVARKNDEKWQDHLSRLERRKTSTRRNCLSYNVIPTIVNAANYGVPQKRYRVFIVGFRDDLDVRWSFPQPTHSAEALLIDQYVTGEYWERHGRRRPLAPSKLRQEIAYYRTRNDRPNLHTRPWMTVRDALDGLPDPREPGAEGVPNHRYQAGARSYVGHTGSPLDLPAKALKAGDHGVPGGENMMVDDDGSVRYFTVRESARLQTFPDGYVLHGTWSEAMRQLGNAVPVRLGQIVAASVANKLLEYDVLRLAQSKGRA